MERNLLSNHRYRLNEDSLLNKDGKMYVFVKLTDSCLKTIENAIQANKRSLNQIKANIQFHHHGGDLSIPTSNGEKRTYSFQLASEDKTMEVFECLKQTSRNEVQCCSTIDQRINIQAQEDVYSMTKTRVTEFQKHEELTKKQTKEIGDSSKKILEQKTKKSSHPLRSSTTTTSKAAGGATTTTRPSKGNELEHLSPTNSSHHSSLLERPLRERLIHFLALRRYRRPDLLLQLKYGEMKDEDKEQQLNHLLSTLTSVNKANEYILSKQFFFNGELNPDWPFYSKADSNILKKKIHDLQSMANRPSLPSTNAKSSETNADRPRASTSQPSKAPSTAPSVPRPPTTTTTTSEASATEQPARKSFDETSSSSSLPDEKLHQFSDLFDKLSNAVQSAEPADHRPTYLNERGEEVNEANLDEVEREYNRLLPEHNQLIDYLEKIAQRFSPFEEDFRLEQTNDKATKIVEEFLQCEQSDSFLKKRQRATQLNEQLTHFKSLLERETIQSDWDQLDISDDDEDNEHL